MSLKESFAIANEALEAELAAETQEAAQEPQEAPETAGIPEYKQAVLDAEKAVEEAIAAYNEAFATNNARKIAAALAAVAEAEEAYRAASMEETFIECRAAVRPMTEGIRRAKFHTKRHKEIKVEGKPVGFEIDEGSQWIDLRKLTAFCDFGKAWIGEAEYFAQMCAVRSAAGIGAEAEVTARILKKFQIAPEHKDRLHKEFGGKQISNQALAAQLQKVADLLLGRDAVKVLAFDVKWVREQLTSEGRDANMVRVGNHASMRRLVLKCLHCKLLGLRYDLAFQEAK